MGINIEELVTAKITYNWFEVIDNIRHNVNQLIKNEHMNIYLKYPINIEFVFDDLGNIETKGPNARATFDITTNKYEIIFGRKLLIILRHYSWKILDYNTIFPEIERNEENREKLSKFSDTIFYFWIDFICLHEWAHIVLGHLNYGITKGSKSFQINECTENTNQISNNIFLCLEIDADRFASKMVTARFYSLIEMLRGIFEVDTKVLITNFSISMIHLFDLFFLLSGNARGEKHPSPSERMLIMVTGMQEAIHQNPLLINISEEEFIQTTQSILVNHFEQYHDEYGIKIEDLLQFNSTLEKYIATIKKINLSDYNILK